MSTRRVPAETPLELKVRALGDPDCYPFAAGPVETVETHYAWVFLAGEHAYKLKKPMRIDRMDHLTLAARLGSCLEELRLNRRLAADVYQAVVALARDARGRLRVEGAGEPVEWLVKMRRLRRDQALDRALAAGTVTAAAVERVAALLADFYRNAPPVPIGGAEYGRRLLAQVGAGREALLAADLGLPRAPVESLAALQRQFLQSRPGLAAARAARGCFIEAHGDLRPEHVFLGTPPCVIDCLEFDRDLRLLDPAEELEYFSLECELLGAAWVGEAVRDGYRVATGDAPPDALRAFYRSHRAARRALIVAWHLRDPAYRGAADWQARAARYLRLALHAAELSHAAGG